MRSADTVVPRTFGRRHLEATMHKIVPALVLALVLAGCVTAPPPSQAGAPSPPPPGRTAISIIGTPFLLAFKIPVCVVSAAMAGAMTGVEGALGGTNGPASLEQSLGEDVEKNCGPPWVVNP
jgi:hypothetical protein